MNMSFPTVRRSHDSSYSDDSIIVSTASSASNDSENDDAYRNGGSSDTTRKTTAKIKSGSTTTTTTTTATQVVPVMVTRNHLLHDCPSDVRFYFSSKYIAGENASPKEQAINLRQYAEISKSHHMEVIEVLNSLPATCLASTKNALPTLGTFVKGERERKNRFNLASKELFQTYRHVYANVSTSNLRENKNTISFSQGLRQIALDNLLSSDHVKEFIVDVSHVPFRFSKYANPSHINLWSGQVNEHEVRSFINKNKKISQWKSELKKREKLAATLCESLKKFSKIADLSSASFGIKCVNQPFKIFLAPLAQTLSDCKEGLAAINSLDLGFSFPVSGYEYENTKKGKNIGLMITYANNLAKFIKSNEKLQHLSLCRNGMNSNMLMPVAKALNDSVALESLDLSKNHLSSFSGNSESFIMALVGSLAGKPSLRYVNLAGCGLTDFSADALFGFMKENPQVTICIAENMMISRSHPIFTLKHVEAEHSDVDYSSS